MRRWLMPGLAALALAGCGAVDVVYAPDADLSAAAYRHNGPPELVLFTMVKNATGKGWHSGLMVNGSQRVIFDPAGTFGSARVPERHDVHYGITPAMLEYYIDYHARETYHVNIQRIPVSAAVAERALQLVQANGPVPKAQCTTSITLILQQLPGFQGVPRAFWPDDARKAVALLPGVSERQVFDDSPDNRSDLFPKGHPTAQDFLALRRASQH